MQGRYAEQLQLIDGVLYHNVQDPKRVLLQWQEKQDVLSKCHVDNLSGVHLSPAEMSEAIRREFFWDRFYKTLLWPKNFSD
jgi:hypothetical protein